MLDKGSTSSPELYRVQCGAFGRKDYAERLEKEVTVNDKPVNKPPGFTVTFYNSKDDPVTQALPGETVKITAAARRKTTSAQSRRAAREQADFYLGTDTTGKKLGVVTVSPATPDVNLSATGGAESNLGCGSTAGSIAFAAITADLRAYPSTSIFANSSPFYRSTIDYSNSRERPSRRM